MKEPKDIQNCVCYLKDITNMDEVIDAFCNKASGSYLIRKSFSSNATYTISILHRKGIVHIKMGINDNHSSNTNKYRIKYQSFDKLENLLEFYSKNLIPNDEGLSDLKLKIPLHVSNSKNKFFELQSKSNALQTPADKINDGYKRNATLPKPKNELQIDKQSNNEIMLPFQRLPIQLKDKTKYDPHYLQMGNNNSKKNNKKQLSDFNIDSKPILVNRQESNLDLYHKTSIYKTLKVYTDNNNKLHDFGLFSNDMNNSSKPDKNKEESLNILLRKNNSNENLNDISENYLNQPSTSYEYIRDSDLECELNGSKNDIIYEYAESEAKCELNGSKNDIIYDYAESEFDYPTPTINRNSNTIETSDDYIHNNLDDSAIIKGLNCGPILGFVELPKNWLAVAKSPKFGNLNYLKNNSDIENKELNIDSYIVFFTEEREYSNLPISVWLNINQNVMQELRQLYEQLLNAFNLLNREKKLSRKQLQKIPYKGLTKDLNNLEKNSISTSLEKVIFKKRGHVDKPSNQSSNSSTSSYATTETSNSFTIRNKSLLKTDVKGNIPSNTNENILII